MRIDDDLNSITHREHTDVHTHWRNAGDNLLTAIVVGPGGSLYRLVVEPLPNETGWDWTVWRSDEPPKDSRYGDAPDRAAAIAAAEDQLRNWTAVEWLAHVKTDPRGIVAPRSSERQSGLQERGHHSKSRGGDLVALHFSTNEP